MAEERYLVILFLFHVVFFILLIFLQIFKIIKLPRRNLMLAAFLPFWGSIMVLLEDIYTKKDRIGEKEQEILELQKIRSSMVHRTILPEVPFDSRVVPLEEALVLEDPAVRRKLILEIVQEDPKHYIALLKKVRLGNDSEVSHYASTAIMQVQREYETNLRKIESKMKEQTRNEETLQEYTDLLNEYIHSGLLPNNVLIAQRRKLNTVYVNVISESEADKNTYRDAIDNLIELNDVIAAEAMLLEAEISWKADEEFILLKLKLYYKTKNSLAMKKEIQSVKESGMYLSPKARDVIEFWSN